MYKWATLEQLLEPDVLLTRRCIFRDDLAYFSNTKPASLLVLGEIMHISWVTFTCVKAPLMTHKWFIITWVGVCVGVVSVCACHGASPGFEGRGQVRRRGFPRRCHWLSESGSEEMTGRFQLLSGSSPCGGAWYRREFLWRELLGRIYTNTHTHKNTQRVNIQPLC